MALSIADKMGFKYLDVRLGMSDETDFKFPFLKDPTYKSDVLKVSSYAVPEWSYEGNLQPTIIHFEELNRAPQFVRNADSSNLVRKKNW
jgi:hypothetical protein